MLSKEFIKAHDIEVVGTLEDLQKKEIERMNNLSNASTPEQITRRKLNEISQLTDQIVLKLRIANITLHELYDVTPDTSEEWLRIREDIAEYRDAVNKLVHADELHGVYFYDENGRIGG